MTTFATASAADHLNIRTGNTLRDVFGVAFDIVRQRPAEIPACTNPDCGWGCACSRGIYVDSAGQHRWQVTLRGFVTDDRRMEATAVVPALDRETVVRTAQVALDMMQKDRTICELNSEVDYFIQQVTGDLEEACWFRRMAEQVAACRANEPTTLLCERILPQLRNLLFARSVVVLQESGGPGQATGLRIVALDTETGRPGDVEQLSITLAQDFADQARAQAVVQNSSFPSEPTLGENAHSFVLVRIGNGSHHFGWLAAMGRKDVIGPARQSRQSESEFGTHEASLMETAAVLLATHAANCDLFAEQERTLVGMVTAMVNALDARDPYTRGHSHRVAMIAQRIARELGLDGEECEDIYLTGLLHDIGKIGVPDHVLLKNGPLDPDERRQIELHTVIGHAILKPVRQLHKALPGVLHHHERMDGTGYPGQLAGQEIPLAGRILAVADAFDAMTTCRPYRRAMPALRAVQILLAGAGIQWDKTAVDAFFAAMNDVQQIYQRYDEDEPADTQQALLQYGRFEDLSRNRLADFAKLNIAGS